MAEFVDKAKLMSRIESELMRWSESEYNALQILGDIEDFPTADVVEVVRCKNCKRCHEHRTKRNKQLMRFCMRMDGNEYQVNANDFCSFGTPKERGADE